MKRQIKFFNGSIVFVVLFFAASCLTINVYFPAAAVQKAADEFVEDVQSGTPGAKPAASATPKQSSGIWNLNLISVAHADGDDAIKVDTPVAKKLKEAMKARAPQIAAFKDKGAIGEGSDGLLAERDMQALALPDRAKAKQTISAENADRTALYREIVSANKYSDDKISEVQSIFAKSWQAAAQPGWWIQTGGTWKKK